MQDLRPKIHGHSWSCPKMPGTMWLHCFFFAIWNFFASPQSCLFGIRGWPVLVGGWYLCSDFLCMSFSLLSKIPRISLVCLFLPSRSRRSREPNKHFGGTCAGWGFRFRLPCSCFETRMHARLIRLHHTHNTCITQLLSLHETSIALHITCLIWCFTHLSRYIYLPTDSFPSVGGRLCGNCL